MVQHGANWLLVLDDVLFLVVADESLQHHLHCIELPIPKAPDQVDLAESSNSQALAYLIFFEPSISHVFEAVKGGLFGEYALADGDLIVKEQVLVDRLETDDLCSFEKRVVISHIEVVSVDFLMENIGQVFGLDAGGKLDFEEHSAIVQCDYKKCWGCRYARSLWVELREVLFCPLVDPLRIYSIFLSQEYGLFSLLFLHF